MSKDAFPRRTLLKMAGVTAAGAIAPRWSFAGPFQAAESPIPTDKKLDPSWVRSLTARGVPKLYAGGALQHIGMPIGGIGCGLVYLSGDGRLWHWDIFNYDTFGVYPGKVRYKGDELDSGSGAAYVDPPTPKSPFDIGFALQLDGHDRTMTMDGTGWEQVTFLGQYPIGTVAYASENVPLRVQLEAFSPFVPLETDDSSLPVTVMRYRLSNSTDKPIAGKMIGNLQNPVLTRRGDPETTRLRLTPVAGTAHGFQLDAFEVTPKKPVAPDYVFDDFQHPGYPGWTVEGTAFGNGPIKKNDAPAYQGEFGGPGAWMVNSHATAPGVGVEVKDAAVGKLTSKPFLIRNRYLNVWIGGGNFPKTECLNVVVEGQVVASATGRNRERMSQVSLDLKKWVGHDQARIEIIDAETGGWGHINVGPIVFSDARISDGPIEAAPDFGSIALLVVGEKDEIRTPEPQVAIFGQKQSGTLERSFTVPANGSVDVTFLVAWHFPNSRLDIADDAAGRHYKKRFKDAAAVAKYVAGKAELLSQTKEWVNTWYEDSTLPHYFLNRTMSSASTLATTTCHRLGTGRFYAYEGVGCCAGTCTHVWHYAQTVGRLFPELERDTRERVDLGVGFVNATGEIWFRAEFDHSSAVDGQAGTVLRFLREHQMSPDDKFLKRCWPRIRKSIEFLIARDGTDDGLLKGPQGNTLDAVWYGLSSWLSSLYLAALLAGERMARTVGDAEFADRCRAIFEKGQVSIAKLYNGEYYFQMKDPAHANVWGAYDACHVDQVFGQGWARQLGLERVLPKAETVSALSSIWKYNFMPNIGPWREKHKAGRWYAIEGDAGLIVATNPKNESNPFGDPAAWQNVYFTETWTGVEHQVAGHMLAEGLITEGLAIIRAVDDRLDGNLRNPYNEIECSDHYARAMSAYGAFVSVTGFEIDAPAGYMGFGPKLNTPTDQFAWVGATGWGTYWQGPVRDGRRMSLQVRHGSLRLRKLKTGIVAPDPGAMSVMIGDQAVKASLTTEDGIVVVKFPEELLLERGSTLYVADN